MGKRLEGKTVLVTDASSGIGRSVAQEFATTSLENLKIILAARPIKVLDKVAESINKEFGGVVKLLTVKLDISKSEEVSKFFANLPEQFRDISFLVNDAGLVKGVDKAPTIRAEDIKPMFATNVIGLAQMTQGALSIFKEKSGGIERARGDMIIIGSIAGREGYQGGSIYC